MIESSRGPTEAQIDEGFRAFVSDERFPCLAGKGAVHRGDAEDGGVARHDHRSVAGGGQRARGQHLATVAEPTCRLRSLRR